MTKIVSAEEAVSYIKSNSTLVVNAFSGICFPDSLGKALGKRFQQTGQPTNLEYWTGMSGSWGQGLYSERFCYEKLLKRVVCSHWQSMPDYCKMISEEKFEAYNLPLGVMSHLYRAAAGKKPGILSKIGLKTFVDPRYGGAKFNQRAEEDIVELIEVGGEEYLFYKAPKIDVCFIRGTTADRKFNVTMEKEAAFVDIYSIAAATKANNGIVICQVERINDEKAHPKEVKVPGLLIDYIVVDPDQKINRVEVYNPAYTGEIQLPKEGISQLTKMLSDKSLATSAPRGLEHKIIARRASLELKQGSLNNLGIGLPNMISHVANEEGVSDLISLTTEAGSIGGVPAPAAVFGSTINPDVILDQASLFDLYDGGCLDAAFVGVAQVDERGNVNVSKIGNASIGVGGFINLTQPTKKVVFCTTFTSGKDFEIKYESDSLKIVREGKPKKFVKQVDQITFSGEMAQKSGQEVLYITERCVFRLEKDGLTIIEVAPGIDIEKDIMGNMPFTPLISENVAVMNYKLFSDKGIDLKKSMSSCF